MEKGRCAFNAEAQDPQAGTPQRSAQSSCPDGVVVERRGKPGGQGFVGGEGDFDAEARRRGGKGGEAAGKSKPEGTEPAEIFGLRREALARLEGWREHPDEESMSWRWVSGEKDHFEITGWLGGKSMDCATGPVDSTTGGVSD